MTPRTDREAAAPLTRQDFYDALERDANDDQYALADRIFDHVAALHAVTGPEEGLREAARAFIGTWDRVTLTAVREGWPAMPQDFGSVADAVKDLRRALGDSR